MLPKQIFIVFLALSFTFANPCSQKEPQNRTPDSDDKVYDVAVIYPEFVSVPKTYHTEGVFDYSEATTVTAKFRGEIDQVFVNEGDAVAVDDPLVSLSNSEIVDIVDIKRAKVREYTARLKETQEKLAEFGNEDQPASMEDTAFLDEDPGDEAIEKDYGSQSTPPERPRTLKAVAEMLEALVDGKTKEADLWDKRLLELNHLSPVNGVVTKKIASEGNNANEKDPLIEIVQTDPMSVTFNLPQDEASFVDKHSDVKVSPVDAPEVQGTGQVYYIDPSLSTGTDTIQVRAHVSNDENKIKGGQKASVAVTTRKTNRVIMLPKNILFYENDKKFVFIVFRERAKLVEVTTGDEDSKGNIQIFGDLRVDDPIIIDRPLELRHNSFVKIQETRETTTETDSESDAELEE